MICGSVRATLNEKYGARVEASIAKAGCCELLYHISLDNHPSMQRDGPRYSTLLTGSICAYGTAYMYGRVFMCVTEA